MQIDDLVRLVDRSEREPQTRNLLRNAMMNVPFQLAEVFVCRGEGPTTLDIGR